MTRTERRSEARARVITTLRARLAERAAQPPAPPGGLPRHDDEWAAGVAWLDHCASDDVWPDPAPTEST